MSLKLVLLFFIAVCIGCLPTIISDIRKHPHTLSIFVTNCIAMLLCMSPFILQFIGQALKIRDLDNTYAPYVLMSYGLVPIGIVAWGVALVWATLPWTSKRRNNRYDPD